MLGRNEKYIVEMARIAIDELDIEFVGYSAGFLSNLVIDDLFVAYSHLFQVDFGSMFDGYFGRVKRSYIKSVDWNELLEKNT